MLHHSGRLRGWWTVALMAFGMQSTLGADDPSTTAKRAVAPIAPTLPGPVVAAMQEGKYAEAATAFDRLIAEAKSPSDKSYYRFLRGIAERLGGKPDDARRTFAEALELEPKGPWAAKIRFELAAVELASGRSIQAEASTGRGRDPPEPRPQGPTRRGLLRVRPPPPLARRSRLEARAERRLHPPGEGPGAGQGGRAPGLAPVRDGPRRPDARGRPSRSVRGPSAGGCLRPSTRSATSRPTSTNTPSGADRPAARFHLGEAQLAAGQNVAARMTWPTWPATLGDQQGKGALLEGSRRPQGRRALYQISRTHGIPNPPDDTQFNLGVAALRRFLAEALSAHPKAVRASFEIGASYLRPKSGRSGHRIAPLVPEGGRSTRPSRTRRNAILADLKMTATFLVARRRSRPRASSMRRSPRIRATWPATPTARSRPGPSERSSTRSSRSPPRPGPSEIMPPPGAAWETFVIQESARRPGAPGPVRGRPELRDREALRSGHRLVGSR